MMNDSIPGSSLLDAKSTLKQLEKRWARGQSENFIYERLAEIEENEQKKKEKLERYLTAEELCRQSGLTLEELKNLNEYRLLVPDIKGGKYRPKLVGWGKKLKEKLSEGWTYEDIKQWTKARWKR